MGVCVWVFVGACAHCACNVCALCSQLCEGLPILAVQVGSMCWFFPPLLWLRAVLRDNRGGGGGGHGKS